MAGFHLAQRDGTIIGKFEEQDLLARISRGEVARGDQYSTDGSVWKPVLDFPSAQFPAQSPMPPRIRAGMNDKGAARSWRILWIVLGGMLALALVANLGGGNMPTGGVLGLVVGLLLLSLAIMWIAFPIIVLSKFNELLKIQAEILSELRRK